MNAATLEREVRARMGKGADIDEVDEELIAPASIPEEQKAALWLLAWSCVSRRQQRRDALSMLRAVGGG